MAPTTELDIAKGLQASIGDLDLNHPHARECCLGLMSSLERSLDRIKSAEWEAEDAEFDRQNAVQYCAIDAHQLEAEYLAQSLLVAGIRNNQAEDEAMDELEARCSHVEPVFAPKGLAS